MKKLIPLLLPIFVLCCFCKAAIVTFTGGTGYLESGNTIITTTTSQNYGVINYQEQSVILEYVSPTEDWSFQTVGDYYDVGNDVIHGHWTAISSIEISLQNNNPFDLQYFQITSNTSAGGQPATNEENIGIQGYLNGSSVTEIYALPSVDWGASSARDVFLPSSFDNVDKVVIFDRGVSATHTGNSSCPECGNSGFCFGMDNFVFDEAVPNSLVQGNGTTLPVVPEANSLLFLIVALLPLFRRKR
jgi:hypothetical protein